jgi:hypothetical protein
MKHYTELHMKKPCDVCSTLRQSESFTRAYRKVANDAINYLLDLHYQQRGGQLGEVDCERVTLMLDELLSLEKFDKNGNEDNGAEFHNPNLS